MGIGHKVRLMALVVVELEPGNHPRITGIGAIAEERRAGHGGRITEPEIPLFQRGESRGPIENAVGFTAIATVTAVAPLASRTSYLDVSG